MIIRDLAQQLVDRYEPAHAVHMRFGDFPVVVRSNSSALIAAVSEYHRAFVSQPDASACELVALEAPIPEFDVPFTPQPRPEPTKKLKEEYFDAEDGRVVRKVRTGMVFLCAQGADVAIGPCLDNINQIINFINSRCMRRVLSGGGVLMHAAAVAREGAGLALAGFSGMGKSTLALHLMGTGTEFVSNDRVVVQRDGDRLVMHGVPKQPRVNPGTLLHNPRLSGLLTDGRRQELERMPADALWALEEKHDVDVQRVFGLPPQRLTTRLCGLVILNWQVDGPAAAHDRVDLSARPELLPAVTKLPGVFIETRPRPAVPDIDPAPYLEMLSSCPVYEITGCRDFDYAVHACNDWLGAAQRQEMSS